MASLPVNDSLHKDLKVECAEKGHKMKRITNKLVQGYLNGDIEVLDD